MKEYSRFIATVVTKLDNIYGIKKINKNKQWGIYNGSEGANLWII